MIVRLNPDQTACGPDVVRLPDGSVECPYGVGSAIVLAGHGVRVDVPAEGETEAEGDGETEAGSEAGPVKKGRKAPKGS